MQLNPRYAGVLGDYEDPQATQFVAAFGNQRRRLRVNVTPYAAPWTSGMSVWWSSARTSWPGRVDVLTRISDPVAQAYASVAAVRNDVVLTLRTVAAGAGDHPRAVRCGLRDALQQVRRGVRPGGDRGRTPTASGSR